MFEGLFQPMHLVVILGIALLVFGPKKLPELGKGLGEAIRGFKTSLTGAEATPSAAAVPDEDAHFGRLAERADNEASLYLCVEGLATLKPALKLMAMRALQREPDHCCAPARSRSSLPFRSSS